MTDRCSICSRELNVPEGDVASRDCGGDCLTCMAQAGDPDAITALARHGAEAKGSAGWPCGIAMVNCDPAAIIGLTLMTACDNAPYANPHHAVGELPKAEEVAFWDRVKAERGRIAQWIVSGLDIKGRAR